MSNAHKALAARLKEEVEMVQAIIDDMKAGRQTSGTVDAQGRITDTTPERVEDFTRAVESMKAVIDEIEGKNS